MRFFTSPSASLPLSLTSSVTCSARRERSSRSSCRSLWTSSTVAAGPLFRAGMKCSFKKMRLFNLITPRPRKGSVRAQPGDAVHPHQEHMVKDNQAETIRIGTAGLLRAFLPSRGLLIIGERGEARFQPLKLAYLVGAARGLYQLSAFGRLLLNALWSIAAHIVKTTLPCLRLLQLHPIGRTEIFSGMGDQLCVAWMIDRFHADDRVHQLGIMVVNV